MYVEFVLLNLPGGVASQSEWRKIGRKMEDAETEDRCASFSLACHVRAIGNREAYFGASYLTRGRVLCVVALCGAL